MQLGQLQEIEEKLVAIGFQVLAVSPDRPEKLKASVEKLQLRYRLVSDHRMEGAKAFGIAFQVDEDTVRRYAQHSIDLEEASGKKHHLLPVPSVFVVGTDGIIQFQYVNPNYRVRLDPAILLAVAERCGPARTESPLP